MENCQENAKVLREGLEKTGRLNIVSKEQGVPLVAFSLKDNTCHDEFEVSHMLLRLGWIVPAYTMLANAQHIIVLRVVVREDFSCTLTERLVADITKVLHQLDAMPAKINAKVVSVTNKNDTVKKTDVETRMEITNVWKRFIIKRKTAKSQIC